MHPTYLILILIFTASAALLSAWITARIVRGRERQVRSEERIADLTAMTGGLAHEIKNPLSTVNLNLQLLQEDLRDLRRDLKPAENDLQTPDRLNRISRRLDSLTREAGRLRSILEDFLSFAGRVKLSRQTTNINDLVSELGDFFAPQAQAAGLNLRLQPAAHPAEVDLDPDLIKQALLNLMINAVRATEQARKAGLPHGGGDELIIRTSRSRPAKAASRRRKTPVEEVAIHVIDTGPGMDQEKISRIFQPYFSTLKGGTGLGLPIARRLVEEHGGRLEVFSEPGRGSDFSIVIPVAPKGELAETDSENRPSGTQERGESAQG